MAKGAQPISRFGRERSKFLQSRSTESTILNAGAQFMLIKTRADMFELAIAAE